MRGQAFGTGLTAVNSVFTNGLQKFREYLGCVGSGPTVVQESKTFCILCVVFMDDQIRNQ